MKARSLDAVMAEYERIPKRSCPFFASDYENIRNAYRETEPGKRSVYDLIYTALRYGYVVGIRQERYQRQRLRKRIAKDAGAMVS